MGARDRRFESDHPDHYSRPPPARPRDPTPPDLSHPSLRGWLTGLPRGRGRSAAFETRVRWSPGGATGTIEKALARAGYPRLDTPQRFVVSGKYGPLRDGELERARAWGAALARAMEV